MQLDHLQQRRSEDHHKQNGQEKMIIGTVSLGGNAAAFLSASAIR